MSDNKKFVAVRVTRLSTSASSTDTSITVAAVEDIYGNTLTMTDFGDEAYCVFEPDSTTNRELGLITAISSTTLTITRGIDAKAPYTATAGNRKSHAAGTKFIIYTNAPGLYNGFANRDNDETISETWTFTNPNYPRMDSAATAPTDDEELIPKKYADDLAIAGAPDSTATVKGIVETATSAETQAGTDSGGTTAPLFALPSDIAANAQNASHTFAADAEASDTYAITLAPAIAAYAAGQLFCFTATTVNTGAATLNVNAKGAKNILKNHDQALEDGDIEAGSFVIVGYDGTQFQLLNQQATMPTTALLTEMATFFSTTSMTGAQAETLTNSDDASSVHYHDTYENAKSEVDDNNTRTFVGCRYDGIPEVEVGTGVVTRFSNSSTLFSTAVGDDAGLVDNVVTAFGGDLTSLTNLQFTWGDNPSYEMFAVLKFSAVTDQDFFYGFSKTAYAVAPVDATETDQHAAFMIQDGTIYASIADGVTQERSDVTGAINLAVSNLFEIQSTGGSTFTFKINGATVATLSGNVPGGTDSPLFNCILTGQTVDDRVALIKHPFAYKLTNKNP